MLVLSYIHGWKRCFASGNGLGKVWRIAGVEGLRRIVSAQLDVGIMRATPMATRTVRFDRGGRARTRDRLSHLRCLLLVAPATLWLLTGRFSNGLPSLWGMGFLFLLCVGVIVLGLRARSGPGADFLPSFLGGWAAITALFAFAEISGGLRAALFPVLLAALAMFILFNNRGVAYALAGLACVYELVLWFGGPASSGRSWVETLSHIELLGLVCLLPLALELPKGVRRLRPARTRTRTKEVPPEVNDDVFTADDGGLLNTATQLALETCGAEVVSLLVLAEAGDTFAVLSSTDTRFLDSELPAHLGIVGGVVRTGQAVVANHLRSEMPGTLHGPDQPQPKHVMAAPIRRGRRVVAVLLGQRWSGEHFGADNLDKLKAYARLLSYSLAAQKEVERVTDAHFEIERFFDASRMLNNALTPEEVYRSAIQALEMIAPFDLTLFTWLEPDGSHSVVHTSGLDTERLAGCAVDSDRSLASMVVKNGHYLPFGCEYRGDSAPIVCAGENFRGLKSSVVLPLRLHDRVTGTLAVGSSEPHMFSDQRRGMLEVIANQLSVSLANARAYARVQSLSVTDALTGLFNRRMFHERLDEALARSERSGGPLTLVILDIDHFKVINDTYGHPVGDDVLRELGATIRNMMRRTDSAARYGGEEFALILEDTDVSGALVLAERLRKKTGGLIFKGPKKETFSIALSLGLAGLRLHAEDADSLIDAADKALYEAKHGGRNQSRIAAISPNAPEIPEGRGAASLSLC